MCFPEYTNTGYKVAHTHRGVAFLQHLLAITNSPKPYLSAYLLDLEDCTNIPSCIASENALCYYNKKVRSSLALTRLQLFGGA